MKTKQARAQNTAGQTTVEPQVELLPEPARPVDPCRSSLHFETVGFTHLTEFYKTQEVMCQTAPLQMTLTKLQTSIQLVKTLHKLSGFPS